MPEKLVIESLKWYQTNELNNSYVDQTIKHSSITESKALKSKTTLQIRLH